MIDNENVKGILIWVSLFAVPWFVIQILKALYFFVTGGF